MKLSRNEPVSDRRSHALRLKKEQSSNRAILFDDEDLACCNGGFDFVKSGQLIRETIKRTLNRAQNLRGIAF
jgi:hypothetical protein